MRKILRLNQLTIKMHFTVTVTDSICQKEVSLILYIEIIDSFIGPMMVENLVKIQIDPLTVSNLQKKNPLDKNGEISECNVFGSVYH